LYNGRPGVDDLDIYGLKVAIYDLFCDGEPERRMTVYKWTVVLYVLARNIHV